MFYYTSVGGTTAHVAVIVVFGGLAGSNKCANKERLNGSHQTVKHCRLVSRSVGHTACHVSFQLRRTRLQLRLAGGDRRRTTRININ